MIPGSLLGLGLIGRGPSHERLEDLAAQLSLRHLSERVR